MEVLLKTHSSDSFPSWDGYAILTINTAFLDIEFERRELRQMVKSKQKGLDELVFDGNLVYLFEDFEVDDTDGSTLLTDFLTEEERGEFDGGADRILLTHEISLQEVLEEEGVELMNTACDKTHVDQYGVYFTFFLGESDEKVTTEVLHWDFLLECKKKLTEKT